MIADTEQANIWNGLYRKVVDLFSQYGVESAVGNGDFWVVEDNHGLKQIVVNPFNLALLKPEIVAELQRYLYAFPGWEIVIALDIPGKEDEWPSMGLIVRKHEIIDGLQREYLPPPYNRLEFPGSRPGTGYD